MKYKEKFVSEETSKPIFNTDEKKRKDIAKNIKPGSVVSLKIGARYLNGVEIPSFFLSHKWLVDSVEDDIVTVDTNLAKTQGSLGKVKIDDLILEDADEKEVPHYKVKLTNCINVREDAGAHFKHMGIRQVGEVFTIIAEKEDYLGQLWGKAKELDGNWILLKFTERIEPIKVPVEIKVDMEESEIEEDIDIEIEEL